MKGPIRPTWPGLHLLLFSLFTLSSWFPLSSVHMLPQVCTPSLSSSLTSPPYICPILLHSMSVFALCHFFQSLVLSLTRPPSSSINSLIASMVVKHYSFCSCLCIWHAFIPFCCWVIFHGIYVPHILCLFLYWWTYLFHMFIINKCPKLEYKLCEDRNIVSLVHSCVPRKIQPYGGHSISIYLVNK